MKASAGSPTVTPWGSSPLVRGETWMMWASRAKKRWPLPLRPLQMLLEEVNALAMSITSLDLWPLRYSSLFELQEGVGPVPPDHADFHRRYRAVGLFPGIGILDHTRILVELTRMLSGVLRPLI